MRILIIEDEEALRELLEYSFSRSGAKVTSLDNAGTALMVIEDWLPDLILLDLMLPGLHGLQFLEIFRQKNKETPVIIISARNSEADIILALEKGADDYVAKPFSFKFLEAKMHTLLKRGKSFNKTVEILNSGGITLDLVSHRALNGEEILQLTQKEFDLLKIFIERPARVLTRNQLLNAVWGYEADLISRTVDAHVATLRKKLGDKGHHIQTIPKIGYVWEVKD